MRLPLLKIIPIFFLFTIFSISFPFHKTLAAAPPTGLQEKTVSQQSGNLNWIADPDVTFAGKSSARAAQFVDWTLKNYQWSVNDIPLSDYWVKIRNIVYVLLILAILAASAVMIITHGNNVSVFSFIRLLFIAILLITLSFALIKTLYQLTDIFQGFFLNISGKTIGSSDIGSVQINYKDFQGLRLSGTENDEAVFTSVNLIKLTTITYMVMGGILLVRKIVLWFFIIISPIFPLLIFYIPLRNTAKIWIGEFFRWLLYAPLFSILLSGLVTLWKTQISVLPFKFIPNSVQYPTAINILLGGPGQNVSLTNSLNNNDTFIQYIVALIMLWMVIFLPWLLLKIFLDYIGTVSLQNSNEVNSFIKTSLGRIPQPEFVKNITNGNIQSSENVNVHVRNNMTNSSRIGNFLQGLAGTTQTTQKFNVQNVQNVQSRSENIKVNETNVAAPLRTTTNIPPAYAAPKPTQTTNVQSSNVQSTLRSTPVYQSGGITAKNPTSPVAERPVAERSAPAATNSVVKFIREIIKPTTPTSATTINAPYKKPELKK